MMLIAFDEAHIPICAQIFYDVFTTGEFNYEWLEYENVVRYFTDLYNTPGFAGYVYVDGGEILGGCLGAVSDYFLVAQYEIKEIFVAKQHARRGVGSRLLAEVEADLQKRGVGYIFLLTDKSINAYNFYQKNNYMENSGIAHMSKTLTLISS